MRNYNKYKKYNKKRKIISPLVITLIVLAIIAVMAIGYANFYDSLKIVGTTNIGTFSITYNLNGGTNAQNPITTYDATTNAPLPIPTYTGYIFAGWYENDSGIGTAISTTPTRKQCKELSFICKMGTRNRQGS